MSDTEMFAAYCLGIFEQREKDRSSAPGMPCTYSGCDNLRSNLAKERAEDAQLYPRYQQYMAAKLRQRLEEVEKLIARGRTISAIRKG
jgi:hypothetical protein